MATASIRPPAVAGMFYPADPRVLQSLVNELLAQAASGEAVGDNVPKVLVVPHAGYIYSGAVAAQAYARLARLRHRIERVILLGPAHRVPVRSFALSAAQSFSTPLGIVPLDQGAWRTLQRRNDVVVDDRPHAFEHCLEVQLPFLQTMLDHFELVPLLVGDAPPEAVADVLSLLWGGDETLIVISSDLSHYHRYDEARAMDRGTIADILQLRGTLDPEQACGARPLNGLLHLAASRGLRPQLIDLRNSGDTAGDRSSVVGYASLAFCQESDHDATPRH